MLLLGLSSSRVITSPGIFCHLKVAGAATAAANRRLCLGMCSIKNLWISSLLSAGSPDWFLWAHSIKLCHFIITWIGYLGYTGDGRWSMAAAVAAGQGPITLAPLNVRRLGLILGRISCPQKQI